jgi:hypothetical protein
MQDKHITKVIFRRFKDNGDVIALFPELPANNNPYEDCESYMRVGQHGAACVTLGHASTLPVTLKEALPLFNELTSLGYNLKVIHSFHASHRAKRIQALKEQRNGGMNHAIT